MPFTLDDRAALHDLYARYAYTFDGADADGWSALFAPDGSFTPPGSEPVVGTAALRAFVAGRSGEMPGMRHMMANVLVEADGDDRATGRAYFVCYRLGGDRQFRLRNFGRYNDKFVRHDSGWRIASRDIVTELDAALVDAPFAFDAVAAAN
jgi:3-phenylpropionate/cinnamic acid dioxygenase small subunit